MFLKTFQTAGIRVKQHVFHTVGQTSSHPLPVQTEQEFMRMCFNMLNVYRPGPIFLQYGVIQFLIPLLLLCMFYTECKINKWPAQPEKVEEKTYTNIFLFLF